MVKPVLPKEVEDSLGWLIREGGGLGWEGLVDYGVHVAISESGDALRDERRGRTKEREKTSLTTLSFHSVGVYDDRKESFVRDEIVGKKEEVDEIAAS